MGLPFLQLQAVFAWLIFYIFVHITAPTPTVNVNAIGNETAGSSLSLKCNAIVVKGINSSVDFIWMNDDGEILREINTVEYQENSTRLIYTSYYNISLLETTDDDTMYICEAVINTNSAVNNSDSYTLNVTGKYSIYY